MILAEFAHIATHGQVRDVEADPVDNWHNEDIEKNPDLYVSKYSYQLVKFASCTYYVTLIHLFFTLTLRALFRAYYPCKHERISLSSLTEKKI